MSRVFDALRQMEKDHGQPIPQPAGVFDTAFAEPLELRDVCTVDVKLSSSSRLVALTDSRTLGAEKFRALANRLEKVNRQTIVKSLQVTSASINEGKTLVAANLAVTLAKSSRSRVLLLEGDLHRPALAILLGLEGLQGLTHWFSRPERHIASFLRRLNDLPLWFLGAGMIHEMPSQILKAGTFVDTFRRFSSWFDWIIVDSTPILPVADANVWSELVDGTLLVVREGVTPVKSLKKSIWALDNPKFVGVVMNDASEFDQGYNGAYYGVSGSF